MANKRSFYDTVIESFGLETPRRAKRTCLTKSNSAKRNGSLVWKINGSSLRSGRNLYYASSYDRGPTQIQSPTFRISGCNTDWKMKMNIVSNEISLSLQASSAERFQALVEFAIINTSGAKTNVKSFLGPHDYEVRGFASLSTLLTDYYLPPNDQLTVTCDVTIPSEIRTGSDDLEAETDLYQDLEAFLDGQQSTDVVLKVGETEILAHKTVLACRSSVFASMFEHDMKERNTNEVVIDDVDSDILKSLVRYMYTDSLSESNLDFLLKLLVSADKYDVKSLRARCVRRLCKNVTADNVFDIVVVSEACRAKELTEKCKLIFLDVLSPKFLEHDWISKLSSRPEVLDIMKEILRDRKSEMAESKSLTK